MALISTLPLLLVLPNAHYGQEVNGDAYERAIREYDLFVASYDEDRIEQRANVRRESRNAAARRVLRSAELERRHDTLSGLVHELAPVDSEERDRVNALLAVERRRDAGEGMSELAGHLLRLYDRAMPPASGRESREDIVGLSKDALDRVSELVDFVNEGMDPPAAGPLTLPLMSYRTNVMSLANLFRDLYEPMDGLINGQTLDLRMLERARSDLHLMQTLLGAVPDLVQR